MTKVMRKKSTGVLLVSSLSLLLATCGPLDDPGQGVEAVRYAQTIDDGPFVTPFGAQVAIGASSIGTIAVWQATDTTNGGSVKQMVEQGLNFDLTPAGTAPALRPLSNTKHTVTAPAVAWSSADGADEFLAVWEDVVSGTNSDIWAALLTSDGKVQDGSPFKINADGDNEQGPTVMWVQSQKQWLVTYWRTHGTTTAISANWVSPFFNNGQPVVSGLHDIIASGSSHGGTTTRVTTSIIDPSGRFLLTYNENRYAFVFTDLTLNGPASSVSGSAPFGIHGTSNQTAGTFGLAWRTGAGASQTIQSQTFPQSCFSPLCATAPVTLFSAGGSITGLNVPVISPLGMGYAIYDALLPASLQSLGVVSVDGNGNRFLTNTDVVDSCSGGLNSSLGAFSTLAAAAPQDPNLRSYLVYDAECKITGFPREWVVAPAPSDLDDFLLNNISH
jgi:hypothetical protein